MPTIREFVTRFDFKVDSRKLDRLDDKIDRLKRNMRGVDSRRNMRGITGLTDRLGRGLGGINTRMKGFDARFNKRFGSVLKPLGEMGSRIPVVGGAFSGLGGAASASGMAIAGTAAAGLAAAAGIAVATKKFADFETRMLGVRMVTGATEEQMRRLKDSALAQSEQSKFTATETAEAQEYLARAGLQVDDVIGALPGTLQLAEAGMLDVATAADIATNIMSSMGMDVDDLTRVNDNLAKAASISNTNIAQIGEAFVSMGNSATLVGVPIEGAAAALASLASSGMRGSLAGTMMRNAFQDMANPAAKSKKILDQAGVSLERFITADGKITDLTEYFRELYSLDAVSKNKFLNTLDERTRRAVAPIIADEKSFERFVNFREQLGGAGGTAAGMAEIGRSGLAAGFQKLMSKLEASAIRFIETSGLNKLFEDIGTFLGDTLPPLIEYLAIGLRPAVVILRHIMSGLIFIGKGIKKYFGFLTDVTKKYVMPVFDKLEEGALKFRKGLLSIFNFGGEGSFLSGIYEKAKSVLASLWGYLKQVFNFFYEQSIHVTEPLVDLFSSLWSNIKTIFNKIKRVFIVLFGEGKSKVGGVLTIITAGVKKIAEAIGWLFKQIFSIARAVVELVSDLFSSFGDDATGEITRVVEALGVAISYVMQLATYIAVKLKKPLIEFLQRVERAVRVVVSSVVSAVRVTVDFLSGLVRSAIDYVVDFAMQSWNAIIGVGEGVASYFSKFTKWLQEQWGWLWDIISSTAELLGVEVAKVAKPIVDFFDDFEFQRPDFSGGASGGAAEEARREAAKEETNKIINADVTTNVVVDGSGGGAGVAGGDGVITRDELSNVAKHVFSVEFKNAMVELGY